MRKQSRKWLLVLIVVATLCFVSGWLWFSRARDPKLSVTYLGVVDGHGHWRLQLGITNVGSFAVFTSQQGEIEIFNRTNRFFVGATSPKSKLVPGEGQVVEAILSPAQIGSISEKWRYTCLYARDELRSQIYHWQWGSNGPGARANWMIPSALKDMPLTVKATSDWINPPKP